MLVCTDEAAAQDPAASAAAVAPFPVSKSAAIPGMEELADRPKPKPKREKSKKTAAVELPKVDETPFVPPPAILEKRCTAALLNPNSQTLATHHD